MEEIVPNVYWLEGKASNLYLVVDTDGLTLIDAGMPKGQQLVLEAIQQLGRQASDLKWIVVTHGDIDHAGSVAALQAATGAQVIASVATAVHLSTGKGPKHMPRLIQWFVDHFVRYTPISAASIQQMAAGDSLPIAGGLQVLATPGHTLDHHSLFSPTLGVLFTGDALNTRNGRINLTEPRITIDQDAAHRSAIQLLQLAPAIIACGHGRPISEHTMDDLMNLFNQLRQE